MKLSFTPDELKTDYSGNRAAELRKLGWEAKPIVDFNGTEYMILYQPTIRPGRQTAEVLNVTEFDNFTDDNGEESYFRIARSGNRGFVYYADEGWAVLTVTKDGEFYDYDNPSSAVLTYRVEPPTTDDAKKTADELDDELQNSIDNGGSLRF